MFEKIVVGVDGQDGGRDALALTGVLASLCNADVVAVRARAHGVPERPLGHLDAQLQRRAELELCADVADAGVTAAARVTGNGSPADALHRTAAEEGAGLIVVGSTHDAAGGRVVVGDVSAATLQAAPCPVAVVPRGWRAARTVPDAIAVGVADEGATEPALASAIGLARRVGASLTLLCVVPLPSDLNVDGAFAGEVRERYRISIDALARRIAEHHDILASGLTVVGLPADELVDVSRAVDLVVVGSQRVAHAHRPQIGRTTERLVHAASCPVLVVPTAAHIAAQALPRADAVDPVAA